jgi:hypothetical protein
VAAGAAGAAVVQPASAKQIPNKHTVLTLGMMMGRDYADLTSASTPTTPTSCSHHKTAGDHVALPYRRRRSRRIRKAAPSKAKGSPGVPTAVCPSHIRLQSQPEWPSRAVLPT